MRHTEHGQICWYEMSTGDTARAREYYSALLGWTFETPGTYDVPSCAIYDGTLTTGGIVQTPEPVQPSPPSTWYFYVSVDNVTLSTKRAKELGCERRRSGSRCLLPVVLPLPTADNRPCSRHDLQVA